MSIGCRASNISSSKGAGIWQARGEFSRAYAAYDSIIQIDPNSATAYANRGIMLLEGQRNEAQSDFERCLKLNERLKQKLEQRIHQVDAQLPARR